MPAKPAGPQKQPGPNNQLSRQLTAEFLGSLFLVFTAISPIILGLQVLQADLAVAVLMDAVAVGFVLYVLIETFGPISGCHINPAVTLALIWLKKMDLKTGSLYIVVQIVGGLLGTLAAHAMFIGQDYFAWLAVSEVARNGGAFFAEFAGTFLLILVIFSTMVHRHHQAGLIIGLLVGGFLITTSSTMFANPQVTIARIFTWAAAGIRPVDALGFIAAQLLATGAAIAIARLLWGADLNQA
ncbi:MAG: aquaporin [Anaerolineales bacterium]|nr:aquaporin [Anaerolineales bacterium]